MAAKSKPEKTASANKKQSKVYKTKRGGRGAKGKLTDEQKAERPWLWPKGVSGNPKGRKPGSYDPVKEIGKKIADMQLPIPAETKRQLKKMGYSVDDSVEMTVLENLLLRSALSNNPSLIDTYLDRTFGKVPNTNVNTNQTVDLVGRFKSKFTDAELEAINNGASALDILFDKIQDVSLEDADDLEEE